MTKSYSLALAVLIALAPLASAPDAKAQKPSPRDRERSMEILSRISPPQMAAVLRQRGNSVEMVTEGQRSRLRTEIGRWRASVNFYSCNDSGCRSIQYRAIFRRSDRFTPAFVNSWNYEKRFAKTYLDREGNLVLEWDVDLNGGVTLGFLRESVSTFQTVLTNFDGFRPRAQGDGNDAGRPETPDMPGEGRSPVPSRPPGGALPSGRGVTADPPGGRRI